MRAVDFACQFLLNISRTTLTATECKVLLCVAAGMSDAADIARRMDIRQCVCTMTLRAMAQRRLLGKDARGIYTPTPAGTHYIEQLLYINKDV